VLHYRVGTGRGAPLRKLTIGRHGSPWTPETARKEAKTLLGMIEDGADPATDKMARREAPTIAELAERFLAEHAEAKRGAAPRQNTSSCSRGSFWRRSASGRWPTSPAPT
jgi:Arm DNA-binding domain